MRKRDAVALIRRVAKAGVAVEFKDHAEEEMVREEITRGDVLKALQNCRVAERTFDVEHEEWKYETKGTAGGLPLGVVVTIQTDPDGLKIVTVWDANKV